MSFRLAISDLIELSDLPVQAGGRRTAKTLAVYRDRLLSFTQSLLPSPFLPVSPPPTQVRDLADP